MTTFGFDNVDAAQPTPPIDLTGVPDPDATDMRITLAEQRATIAELKAANELKDVEIAHLTAELAARKWAKDIRLLPLNARRVLVWIGIFFLFITALAILGSVLPTK